MASQDELLTLLQQLNARSGATIKAQPAPAKRTNAVVEQRPSAVPKLTDSLTNFDPLPSGRVDTINAQNQLSAYATQQSAKFPTLTEQISSIQAGKKQESSGALGALAQIFDNPVAKAILAPITVLDTGRRAIISGVREVADVLDSDKKTKASLTDWFNQTKDPTYGFGTAFPMKGALGRVIGFIGDVALDPLTYATIGASIPASAAIKGGTAVTKAAVREGAEALARGAARETAEQAAEVSLRKLLGTKTLATAEGRRSLAGLAARMGSSDELVKNIAAEGRRAFRTSTEGVELAKKIGLNRSGVYYFGSRVRVPFTGPIADFIETGLVKSRLNIMRSAPGEWMSKNFTTKGTSAARSLKDQKRLLAIGKLEPKEAALAAKNLTNENYARSAANIARDTFAKSVRRHLATNAASGELFDKDVLESAKSIYKYLDTNEADWAANGLPPMTQSQRTAYQKIKNMFVEFHTDVENQFKTIDPNFTLNKIEDYFPHMMSEEGYKYVANNASEYAEQIRQYLKMNMTDPSASFKSRGLTKDAPFFGTFLKEEDVKGGIDRLNQIAREGGFTGGDFFETDITKVLARYGDHYAEQFGTAEFMRLSMKDGILQMAKDMGVVDEDWIEMTRQFVKDGDRAFRTSSEELRNAGSQAIEAIKASLDDMSTTVGARQKFAKALAREAGTPEQRLNQLIEAESKYLALSQKYKEAFDTFASRFEDQSTVVDILREQVDETVMALQGTAEVIRDFRAGFQGFFGEKLGDVVDDVMIDFRGKPRKVSDVEKILDSEFQKSAYALTKMENSWDNLSDGVEELNTLLNSKSSLEYGTGVDVFDEVFNILDYRGIPDAGPITGSRSIDRKWIGSVVNSTDPNIQSIIKRIDPTGRLRASNLEKIRINDYYPSLEKGLKKVESELRKAESTIRKIERMPSNEVAVKDLALLKKATNKRNALLKERSKLSLAKGKPGELMVPGIRSRVARGVTTGDNLADLQEAAAWLVMRDLKIGGQEFANAVPGSRFAVLVDQLRVAEDVRDAISGAPKSKKLIEANESVSKLEKQLQSLTNDFELIPDDELTDASISRYMSNRERILGKLEEARSEATNVANKLSESVREAANRAGQIHGYKDFINDFAATVSEYYLHRETVIQYRRMLATLDAKGAKPSKEMYTKILSRIAYGDIEPLERFSASIDRTQKVIQKLYDDTSMVGADDLTRQIKLREELSKIFEADGEEAKLIREHLPEIEAVWLYGRLDTDARLFYRDPEAQGLISSVINELQAIGKRPDWIGVAKRPARLVTEQGEMIEDVAVGFSVVGGSAAERAAKIDAMQSNIEQAIRTLENHYKSIGRTRDALTGDFREPLTQSLAGPLREAMGNELGRVDGYRKEFERIIAKQKAQKSTAIKLAERYTGKRGAQASSEVIRRAIRSGESYGFAGAFNDALTLGNTAMDDFFAKLLGGNVLDRTTDYTPIARRGNKIVRQPRGTKGYSFLDPSKAYFGKIQARIDDRLRGLRFLSYNEPDITYDMLIDGSTTVADGGKYITGSWALNRNLRGSEAIADALEEHADAMLAALDAKRKAGLPRKIASREAAIARVQEEARKFRMLDEKTGELLPAQSTPVPAAVRKEQLKNARTRQAIERIEGSNEYLRAQTMKSEHVFAQHLASFELNDANEIINGYLARIKANYGIQGNIDDYLFTPDEWAALWNEGMPEEGPFSLRSARARLTNERRQIGRLTAEQRARQFTDPKMARRVERIQAIDSQIAEIDAKMARIDARTSAMNKFGKVEKLFDSPQMQTASGMRSAPKMRSGSPTESMGLLGLSDVVDAEKVARKGEEKLSSARAFARAQRQELKSLSIAYRDPEIKWKRVSKATNDARQMYLETLWKGSDEFALLDQLDGLYKSFDDSLHNQFMARRDFMVRRHEELRGEIAKLRGESMVQETQIDSLRQQIQDAIDVSGVQGKGRSIQAKAKDVASKLRETKNVERNAKEYVQINQEAIDAGTTVGQEKLVQANRDFEEVAKLVENFRFDKIVAKGKQRQAIDFVSRMTNAQKRLFKQKMDLAEKLAKEQGVLERLSVEPKSLNKAEQRLRNAQKAVEVAQSSYDTAQRFAEVGPDELQKIISDAESIRNTQKYLRDGGVKPSKTDSLWVDEVEQLLDDTMYMFHQINGFNVPDEIRRVASTLMEAKNEYLRATMRMSDVEVDRALLGGMRSLGNGNVFEGAKKADVAMVASIRPEAIKITKVFDEGFVQLSKYFPEIGVRQEVAEIFQNVHRINQPLVARELNKFLSKYTTFFKAYATLSPGFHVRNSMSNGFMLFAAGSRPKNLSEGLKWSRSWIEASKAGKPFAEWIAEVPESAREMVSDAFRAAAASGGGLTDDFIGEVAPLGTKKSREVGRWIEQHSRFLMAYDGVAQGMDMNTAAARVKRFLVDYQDLSTADQYMRQIVPFWMWTSRNLPMQLQNMWLNPKAYLMYNNLKRNLEDKDSELPVPLWMREIGAFKLPGTNFYATPDFGFNRVGQQIQELRDPRRLLSNVTPVLRLPIELTGGRQLYSGREFSDQPIQVEDGAGALLQPLLALAGYGETTAEGKKFVNDKAYYALRNLIPFLGTAERLTPSIQTYQQRGYVNPLLGFLGIPTRQLTEKDQQSELARRKREIQNIVSRERTLQGNE